MKTCISGSIVVMVERLAACLHKKLDFLALRPHLRAQKPARAHPISQELHPSRWP
jgi:hypothetical protein